jgi:hypothetical protein
MEKFAIMQQHYNLSDEAFQELTQDYQVSLGQMLECIPLFTFFGEVKSLIDFDAKQVSKVSLLYYIDKHGDFSECEDKLIPIHQLIARAVFKSLPTSEQMEVLEYLSYIEEEEDN